MDLLCLRDFLKSLEAGCVIRGKPASFFHAEIYGDGSAALVASPTGMRAALHEAEDELRCSTSIEEIANIVASRQLPPDDRWSWSDEEI